MHIDVDMSILNLTGTSDGSGRGSQFSIHGINDGIGSSKFLPCSPPIALTSRSRNTLPKA